MFFRERLAGKGGLRKNGQGDRPEERLGGRRKNLVDEIIFEVVEAYRLQKKSFSAEDTRFFNRAFLIQTAHEDHLLFGKSSLDVTQNNKAADPRHNNVAKDEIGFVVTDQFKGKGSVVGLNNGKADLFQEKSKGRTDMIVIIDNEYSASQRKPLGRPGKGRRACSLYFISKSKVNSEPESYRIFRYENFPLISSSKKCP